MVYLFCFVLFLRLKATALITLHYIKLLSHITNFLYITVTLLLPEMLFSLTPTGRFLPAFKLHRNFTNVFASLPWLGGIKGFFHCVHILLQACFTSTTNPIPSQLSVSLGLLRRCCELHEVKHRILFSCLQDWTPCLMQSGSTPWSRTFLCQWLKARWMMACSSDS